MPNSDTSDIEPLPRTVPASDLAEIAQVSTRQITNYAKRGIVFRAQKNGQYYLAESVRGLLLYAACGKSQSEIDADPHFDKYTAAEAFYKRGSGSQYPF